MDCFGRLGFFDPAPLPALARPATCLSFLEAWLQTGAHPEQSTQERERAVLATLKHRLGEALGGSPGELVERAIDCARYGQPVPAAYCMHTMQADCLLTNSASRSICVCPHLLHGGAGLSALSIPQICIGVPTGNHLQERACLPEFW
jgi:hypothetical protein